MPSAEEWDARVAAVRSQHPDLDDCGYLLRDPAVLGDVIRGVFQPDSIDDPAVGALLGWDWP